MTNPVLMVAENIRLPMEPNGMAEPHMLERIHSMLDSVELTDRAGSFPDLLEHLITTRGATLLLVTHSLVVTRMADRGFTLDNGIINPMAEEFAR